MKSLSKRQTSRRHFIKSAASAWAFMSLPLAAQSLTAQTKSNKKLVWIFLRGALDSLHTVIPVGDSHLNAHRADILAPIADQLLPLNNEFSLHPKLTYLHRLYQQKQMMPVVAVANNYRQRSHFEAQDQMESGLDLTDHNSGWLARFNEQVNTAGIAIARSVPIALRTQENSTGASAQTWYPSVFPEADDDLIYRLAELYEQDSSLSKNLGLLIQQKQNPSMKMQEKRRADFTYLAQRCGELLANNDNCQSAMLEIGGWDTHNNQQYRLNRQLGVLDSGIEKMREALGDAWQDTLVVIGTEFGRTVALNGTKGSDHGTASTLLFAGGALAQNQNHLDESALLGGQVKGIWPGLAPEKLFEGRDLMPTSDIRTWLGQAMKQYWQLSDSSVKKVFPDIY